MKFKKFTKNRDSESAHIEINCDEIFPGLNIDLLKDRKIKDMNKAAGGRLCGDKEVLVIEIVDPEVDGFRFKFSDNQKDYMKCSRFTFCGRTGLYPKV